jgi:type IV pilus assembly protein PilE
MKTHGKKRSGFTIIELKIVIGIVALLVSLAYPAYSQYVMKARRGEAQQLLLNWSINQEIWRSSNTEYADPEDDILPEPTHDYYVFDTVGVPDATTYTLQAAAKAGDGQQKDVARDGEPCATLRLDQSGVKEAAACWD